MFKLDELCGNTVIAHIRKHDTYQVIAVGKMEDASGNWVPSVTFCKLNTDEVYTRTFTRMQSKFEIII